MLAIAVLVGSAALVAVTVAVVCVSIDAGAVNSPVDEIVPEDVFHVTAVLLLPVTDDVNCCF